MRRAAALVLAGVLAAGGLAGCKAEPASSGASGEVIKREKKRASHKSWKRYNFYITVRETSGKKDRGQVNRTVYEACQVGDRWPDCKRRAS